MSDKDFVFRIGPIEKPDGDLFLYFVYPGLANNYRFPAASDEAAWAQISEEYDLSLLSCEPALEAGKPPSVSVEPFDPYTQYAIALMVFENLPGRPVKNVRADSILPDLVRASHDFLGSGAPAAIAENRFIVRLQGAPNVRAALEVRQLPDARHQITFDVSGAEGSDGTFGVRFQKKPHFAADAFVRAFGDDIVPMPFVGETDEGGATNDMTLLLTVAALNTLSRIDRGTMTGRGNYSIGEVSVDGWVERLT